MTNDVSELSADIWGIHFGQKIAFGKLLRRGQERAFHDFMGRPEALSFLYGLVSYGRALAVGHATPLSDPSAVSGEVLVTEALCRNNMVGNYIGWGFGEQLLSLLECMAEPANLKRILETSGVSRGIFAGVSRQRFEALERRIGTSTERLANGLGPRDGLAAAVPIGFS